MAQQVDLWTCPVVLDFASAVQGFEDGRRADVETERVQQGEIVFDAGTSILGDDGDCDTVPQFADQSNHRGRATRQVGVDGDTDLGFIQEPRIICADVGHLVVLGKRREVCETFEILRNRRAFSVRAQNNVSKLNAIGGDGCAETDVVLLQKVGEVVKNHNQNAKSGLEECPRSGSQRCILQERVEEFEERHQDPVEIISPLECGCMSSVLK